MAAQMLKTLKGKVLDDLGTIQKEAQARAQEHAGGCEHGCAG